MRNPRTPGGVGGHHGIMMTLHYTGRSVLMPNDVCEAMLRYAQALAEHQTSDVVSVPVIADGGHLVEAEFLLGPASQLYAVPAADSPEDASNGTAVAELERRGRMLNPSAIIGPAPPDDPALRFDLDG